MARRPLVATLVTTLIGALVGAVLGAIVGRVIALLGDETIQPSVPMAFCATLGLFIGGPAAAKGSLDRFGASRSSLGAAVAAVIVIAIVGGTNVGSTIGGPALFAIATVASALAAVAATAVGNPQERPVVAAAPVAATPAATPATPATPATVPSRVARDFDEEEDDDEEDDWSFLNLDEGGSAPEPEPPRRRPPLRAVRDLPPDSDPEPDESTPPRPRRDRPLRRGDADS